MSAASALRSIIESARDDTGGSLKEFTVLSVQIDPYRLDTPVNHQVGQWFAEQMDRLNLLHRQIHLRGIHYAFLGSTTMPNGKPYANTGEVWDWLQNSAAKAARWLGWATSSSTISISISTSRFRSWSSGAVACHFMADCSA